MTIIKILAAHLGYYPTPLNLTYAWGFGSISGIILVIQSASGLLLAMHYTPDTFGAFTSVEHIQREIIYGWLVRYTHSSGSSVFFIAVYSHIVRALFYRSFRKIALWYSGLIIFLLMMATAFLGYVLPWGSMSYWGATVITNLFTAIPLIGDYLTAWLWGGFAIDTQTLKRFFALHFVLPFGIMAVSGIHLILLHECGSSNPIGVCSDRDNIRFYPLYFYKDLFGVLCFLIPIYIWTIFFDPQCFMHCDNYIRADSLVTPRHIQPEWYFLPFYAILRAIPSKGGGVFFMFGSIIVFFFLPWIAPFKLCIGGYSKLWVSFFSTFLFNVLILGILGARVVEEPYVLLSQFCTFYYFFYLLIIMPIFSMFETLLFIKKKSNN